ncbi:hypothetical protein [Paracoccus siganidrum]|uniref:Uncharacterized protein n=1 Tax=Paracoccus siganidrum TaxID=1276757 RepID=A0A419A440_9RHOB|nr:hypothetical protein [Paracoccus siganidrum]RJL08408.1 hypothetical protein D3P05_16185 [Paracoccus siganidrum]RMC39318.1 hypothetical protein C9E82_04895 [Paracoccus siganidrum]
MTPELSAFLAADPEVVPLVRLFHLNFGADEYWLNEGNTPITAAGQVWAPSHGWISADPLTLSGGPFDANPAYYTVWNVGNREGEALEYQALNNPAVWHGKLVRQLWTVRGFPSDAIVMHVGRIMTADPHQSNTRRLIRIRSETIAAYRNYTPLGEYTDRDQQRRHPGDRGCEYAPTLVGKKIKGWLIG